MIRLDFATHISIWRAAAGVACLCLTLPLVSLADEAKRNPMSGTSGSKPSAPQVNTTPPDQPSKAPEANSARPEQIGAAATAPEFSPRATFANICGFCHEDGGRRAGKAPQLMDSTKTDEQLFETIKFGKPGRMAAFGEAFTDDQIRQLVAYIRNLKPR